MHAIHSAAMRIILLLVLGLAGCQSAEPAPSPPPVGPSKTAGAQPIAGARLNPLTARTGRIGYVEGKRKGKTFDTKLEKVDDGWKDTTQGVHMMVMRDDGGAIVMPREEDVDENVAITYDPPFVLLPKEVATGTKFEGETTMTVNNLKTGSKRDSGPCRYTVELLGMRSIETDAGTFEAYLFKTVRQIDLSLAKVTVTIHTAHVPDKGIVMTRVERNTKAVGIFSMNSVDESRLAK